MPACLSKHFLPLCPISPTQIGYDNQDQVHIMPMRKQQQELGIMSILGSNDTISFTPSFSYPQQLGNNNSSLRRTLSADLSSKKWLSNNGFSVSPSPMMKRIGSSDDFHSFKGEKEMGRGGALDDIWSSITKNGEGATADHNQKSPAQFDTWGSIIASNKDGDVNGMASAPLPPAYVHPSVKRAASLSKKSLEICTESLGSETGSDGFSSQPPSEPEGDSDSDEQQSLCSEDQETVGKDELLPAFDGNGGGEEILVPKYNYYNNTASCKRATPKSFPPPLPSLAYRDSTSLLHMRSLRENGRLVLEAVSVPSQNCLLARRQDGRLLLTLAAAGTSEDKENIDDLDFEENERIQCEAEENEEEEEEEEAKYERDKHDCDGIRAINGLAITTEDQLGGKLAKGGLMIKMPRNGKYYSGFPDHHKRLNKVVDTNHLINPEEHVKEEETASRGLASTLSTSLPPRPRAVGRRIIANTASATAGSLNLNAYEYYWRKNINKTPPIADAATWPTTIPDIRIPPQKAGIKTKIEGPTNKSINMAVLNEKPAAPTVIVDGKQPNERREYLVPLLMQQGCKEPRRSLLFWEPYCIATT